MSASLFPSFKEERKSVELARLTEADSLEVALPDRQDQRQHRRRVLSAPASSRCRDLLLLLSFLLAGCSFVCVMALASIAIARSTRESTVGEPQRFGVSAAGVKVCPGRIRVSDLPCAVMDELLTGIDFPLPLRVVKESPRVVDDVNDLRLLGDNSSLMVLRPGVFNLHLQLQLLLPSNSEATIAMTVNDAIKQVCLANSQQSAASANSLRGSQCRLTTSRRMRRGDVVRFVVSDSNARIVTSSRTSFLVAQRLRN